MEALQPQSDRDPPFKLLLRSSWPRVTRIR